MFFFLQGVSGVALKKEFHGYKYEIDFKNMSQVNKKSKRKRPIRRKQGISPYPASTGQVDSSNIDNNVPHHATAPPLPPQVTPYSDLAKDVPGTDALLSQVNDYARNVKRTFVKEDNDNAAIENGLSNLSHTDNPSVTVRDDQNSIASSHS